MNDIEIIHKIFKVYRNTYNAYWKSPGPVFAHLMGVAAMCCAQHQLRIESTARLAAAKEKVSARMLNQIEGGDGVALRCRPDKVRTVADNQLHAKQRASLGLTMKLNTN